MTRRDAFTVLVLVGVGCAQMAGDVLRAPFLKALGAATGASPAPKVFTAQNGFETYANRFYLEWGDANGRKHALEVTPETYSGLAGPYNRRNVYGALISYSPVLAANPLTRPMFHTVLMRSFCGARPVAVELGVPLEAINQGSIRIRLEPRHSSVDANLGLVHEVHCHE